MTEDTANRHMAEKGIISSISGKFCWGLPLSEIDDYNLIPKVVEGMKDATNCWTSSLLKDRTKLNQQRQL